ncbi:hypothetical protein BDP81DRAFT_137040 [Colletotrichum phormii]|uniref:Uncharacterized protein n=1 Tax=Colletotrichum phormii TaxID=359342 RepID=A0AAI9ZH53_9PEZI|nr:uncharacterized protein BDP81DRAFT_137040 [Colletotrichum phormii]KAK1623259.1 hypothetical protein BDP81DRAFT_137040 [Colletotrichum phormii]
MTIPSPIFLPGLDDLEYHGIGMSSEVNVPGFCRDRSSSPDGSSISLEPRIEEENVLRPEIEFPKQAFRRSSAPSPESIVDVNGITPRSLPSQHDEAGRAARSRPGTPQTPEASSSDSLATKTPPTAGPLESYLACPQSHERRALWLPPDDEDDRQGDQSSSNCGSVVLGKRRVPGVYEQVERSTSPFGATQGADDAKADQPLTHYLSSVHPHEVLAYQTWELASKDKERDPILELDVPGPSENAVPTSNHSLSLEASRKEDDIPAASAVLSPAVFIPQGPIEVGYERRGSDSAISDLETEELHQLVAEGRRARQAGRNRTMQPARGQKGRVKKSKTMRSRRE